MFNGALLGSLLQVIFYHFRREVESRCQLRTGNFVVDLKHGMVILKIVRVSGDFDVVQSLQDDCRHEFDEADSVLLASEDEFKLY